MRVLDGLRPWLPLLVALAANSPYASGEDTGYASWRQQAWGRWPVTGQAEPYGSAAEYRRVTEALIATGAALDPGMLYLDARLAASYPTVEIRVADACTDVDDAVLVAALSRGPGGDGRAADGPDADPVRSDLLRAAHWRAARYGLSGSLVHPRTWALVPARGRGRGAGRPRGGRAGRRRRPGVRRRRPRPAGRRSAAGPAASGRRSSAPARSPAWSPTWWPGPRSRPADARAGRPGQVRRHPHGGRGGRRHRRPAGPGRRPDDVLDLAPMADGGPGFVDVLHSRARRGAARGHRARARSATRCRRRCCAWRTGRTSSPPRRAACT